MYMSRMTKQAVSDWEYPVVAIAGGTLRGVKKEDGFLFRGVPYARAERFLPPEPAVYENGLFLADHYTCTCPELLTPVREDQYLTPRFYLPQDEDCLNLNIWTLTLDKGAKKPVLLWLGEGDWAGGGANELFASDGENLSREEGFVVVAVNHRTNCLGALDLSEYGEQYGQSGRLCLLDMLAAVRWVRDNIENFGGDPKRVTLYGHGGGGQKVYALMQMPEADGLYHRVVIGGAVPKPMTKREDAVHMTELLMRCAGKNTPQQLREMPYWYLAEAALDAMDRFREETGREYNWAPVADQKTLLKLQADGSLRAETLEIPLLLGSSFGEGASGAYIRPAEQKAEKRMAEDVKEQSGSDMAEAFGRVYPGRSIADLAHMDRELRPQILTFARKQALAGRRVYNYLFDLNVLFKREMTAWKGAELPYFFCNADYLETSFLPGITPALQRMTAAALGSFARNGEPDKTQFSGWESAGAHTVPTMIFAKDSRCVRDFDRELISLYSGEISK